MGVGGGGGLLVVVVVAYRGVGGCWVSCSSSVNLIVCGISGLKQYSCYWCIFSRKSFSTDTWFGHLWLSKRLCTFAVDHFLQQREEKVKSKKEGQWKQFHILAEVAHLSKGLLRSAGTTILYYIPVLWRDWTTVTVCYKERRKNERKLCFGKLQWRVFIFLHIHSYTSKQEVEAQRSCFLGYSCLSCCQQFFQWDPAALSTCHIKYKCLILHMKKKKKNLLPGASFKTSLGSVNICFYATF